MMFRQELPFTTPDHRLLTGRQSSEQVSQNRSEPVSSLAVLLVSKNQPVHNLFPLWSLILTPLLPQPGINRKQAFCEFR